MRVYGCALGRLRGRRMTTKIQEKLLFCEVCEKKTIHHRNTKEMSWVMHLVLAIFTAGLWILIWLLIMLWHVLTKPIAGKWYCSVCDSAS